MAKNLLKSIIEQGRNCTLQSKKPIAVFDLDSTLFCVSYRTQRILKDLCEKSDFCKRYSKEVEILRSIEVTPSDWGIRSALIRAGIVSNLEFFESVRQFWVEHFFSSHYLKHDRPYEGAVEYLQQLAENGVEIRYLTGRDIPRMGPGTLESLQQWKFPLIDKSHLIMKATSSLQDELYKAEALTALLPEGSAHYFFENEPLIIHHVRKELPQVQLIFMDSVHSGKAEPPTGLPTLKMRFEFV